MIKFIEKRSNLKLAVFSFLLASLVYAVMITITIPYISKDINNLAIFDMRPMGYSVNDALEILDNLSTDRLKYYKTVQLSLDILYPFLVAIYGLFAFAEIRKKIKITKLSYILPIMICVFDYLENMMIYIMLVGNSSPIIIKTASSFTIIKSMSTVVFQTILIICLIYIFIKKIRNK